MSLAKKQNDKTLRNYTYSDYIVWPDYPRYELIKGEAVKMSAPSEAHQAVSAALSYQFFSFLRGKECRVYSAPFDVRINYDTTDNTVVQPDLVVICDKSKIENGKHCLGAPDLVVEIISDFSWRYDRIKKFHLYLEAGVREYWIVYPDKLCVDVYILENNKYTASHYGNGDIIPVYVLDGCNIDMEMVFEDMLINPSGE